MAASMEGLRQRHRSQDNGNISKFSPQHHSNKTRNSIFGYYESFVFWNLIIALYIGIICFVSWRFHQFPQPMVAEEGKPLTTGVFYESLARQHLETVAGYGQRPTGSDANEIHTRNYILNELRKFTENSHDSKKISVDVQNVSGSFHMYFIHTDMYSVYKNIKNIVVKLEPVSGAEHSLMVNCHHDTMVDAVGAGDDMSSCAVMLEIIRSLSQSDEPLKHNIIFLFNGAEENLLQGSHGFITQHKWAKSIKAFINLDSAGAGGWEIVFQTGPQNPWLVKAYIESAVYPSASVLNQEVFELGLVPADTDYRIFRDYGQIPGLDIAYISNGYVYHTLNDLPESIPPGCLQRAGENLLNIIKTLAKSPKLSDPGEDKHGSMVFYDLVGLVMVHYPKRIGAILNCFVSFCTFVLLWRKIANNKSNSECKQGIPPNRAKKIQGVMGHNKPGFVTGVKNKSSRNGTVGHSWQDGQERKVSMVAVSSGQIYVKNMLIAFVVTVATWVVCLLVVLVGVALPLSLTGFSMFWYCNTYNAGTVFLLPALITIMTCQELVKASVFKELETAYLEQLFFDTFLVTLAVSNILLTYAGLAMSYLVMLWIFPLLLVRECGQQLLDVNWQSNKKMMLCLHLGGALVPLMSSLYILYMFVSLILPVLGRSGTSANPDVALAAIVTLALLLCFQNLFGLVYLCDTRPIRQMLTAIFVLSVFAVIFTHLGFPFSGDKDSLAPQRFVTVHINREYHNQKGELEGTDSGIWYIPQDYLRDYHSQHYIPELKTASNDIRGEGPYYGLPYLIPMLYLLSPRDSKYIEALPINPQPKVVSSLVSRQSLSPLILRLTFQVTGPDHMTLYIRPQPEISLNGWSIMPGTPQPAAIPSYMNETTYYVYYGHGEAPEEPWQFYIDLKITKRKREKKVKAERRSVLQRTNKDYPVEGTKIPLGSLVQNSDLFLKSSLSSWWGPNIKPDEKCKLDNFHQAPKSA